MGIIGNLKVSGQYYVNILILGPARKYKNLQWQLLFPNLWSENFLTCLVLKNEFLFYVWKSIATEVQMHQFAI